MSPPTCFVDRCLMSTVCFESGRHRLLDVAAVIPSPISSSHGSVTFLTAFNDYGIS
ncbi:hypothetical protein SCHPADRAFT_911927 [Schizopora paradoxa]|uniref:Uncharacterized protein n=1 Tax=Schizopora paradoxa TaxID=27342 RepID=A0A0H2RGC6_9AGAM|nr:hypothetical protein SCHPADRAFT_911927 [Schizopora paradoxa]